MTSSSWSYPIERNQRRIDLVRAITARSLAAQPSGWTWIVYVRRDDPLLDERIGAFMEAGAPVLTVTDTDEAEAIIDWSGPVLTTRVDDDDAFTVDAFARLYRAIRPPSEPTAYMFPNGYHVRDGRIEPHRLHRNPWASVYSPVGFREHIRKHQHQRIPGAYPTRWVDERPAWLRVSHRDNDRPTSHRAHQPITDDIRRMFAVDWSVLERVAV